jgi:prepilin-type N-terminal cleavage/methylation domain-containing protein
MNRRERMHGQTLVEILVVMAIIMIVLSFLLPAVVMLAKTVKHLGGH